MRVLLDECLPRRLRRELTGHDVVTVPDMGWAGKTNGELLRLMQGQFDVFLTIDQGMTYQQNLSNVSAAIVVLVATNNSFEVLRPLMPRVQDALQSVQVGEVIRITG
jgi:predicted nuclease of predicted toxin-antitoxin system